MSDEQTSAPAEASSLSSGVEDEQPTQAPNDQEAKQETAQPKEPEKYTRQHKVFLKQQAELRKEREAFEADQQKTQEREQQLANQAKELERYKAWQEQTTKGNPWQFLRDNGYDLLKLQELAIQYDNDPNLVAKNMADQVRQELDAKYQAKFQEIEQQREAQENARIDQENGQKQQHVLGEIQRIISDNPEKYELVASVPNANQQVLAIIWEAYQMSNGQNVLSYEQAAEAYETALLDEHLENNPFIKTAKARKYFTQSDQNDVVKTERKRSADSMSRSKQNRASQSHSEPKTLSSKMASVSTAGPPGKETFAERKERLGREMANGTWKPKAEYLTPVSINRH